MEKLKRAGSRDPEPATERDDARLPEQWNWPLQQALYCKRTETQDDSTGSQSATAAPHNGWWSTKISRIPSPTLVSFWEQEMSGCAVCWAAWLSHGAEDLTIVDKLND